MSPSPSTCLYCSFLLHLLSLPLHLFLLCFSSPSTRDLCLLIPLLRVHVSPPLREKRGRKEWGLHTDPSRQVTLKEAQECTDIVAWKAVGCGPHEGEASRESRVSSTENREPASGGEPSWSLEGHSATRHEDEEGQGSKDFEVGAGK